MITLTQYAADRILQSLNKRGKGIGIRLGVKTTGCSGLAYVLEYVDTPVVGDTLFEQHNVHVYVDPKSMAYLNGLHIDYAVTEFKEGFEFTNPNERDRCGCGESFRV